MSRNQDRYGLSKGKGLSYVLASSLGHLTGLPLRSLITYNSSKYEGIVPAKPATDAAFACRTQKHANHNDC